MSDPGGTPGEIQAQTQITMRHQNKANRTKKKSEQIDEIVAESQQSEGPEGLMEDIEETVSQHEPDGVTGEISEGATTKQVPTRFKADTYEGTTAGNDGESMTLSQDGKSPEDTDMVQTRVKGEAEKRVITPEALAEVLTQALSDASQKRPRLQTWHDLMQQLFELVFSQLCKEMAERRFADTKLPAITMKEQERLIDLFELIVVQQNKEWTLWKSKVQKACKIFVRTKQSMENVLAKLIGKTKMEVASKTDDVLTGWIHKVTGAKETKPQSRTDQDDFLFNKAYYKQEEINALYKVCKKEGAHGLDGKVRIGTAQEWRIVKGLAEGSIVARYLPPFLWNIMTNAQRLRLILTIRTQVEGCLSMDMRGEMPIKGVFQSTKSIQESIAMSATARGITQGKLWEMLAKVKGISYDCSNHRLNFHFYTREAATKYEKVEVPYHKHTHHLVNNHAPAMESSEDSVWKRQGYHSRGMIGTQQVYIVLLRNVSRNIDILKLNAFLEERVKTSFRLQEMDQGGPMAASSLDWELRITAGGCPKVLEGIRRIFWCGIILLVEHPTTRGRRHCLRCGEVGHQMRGCPTSEKKLREENCIWVSVEDVNKIKAPPPTFASMEDLYQEVTKAYEEQQEGKGQEATQISSKERTQNDKNIPEIAPGRETPEETAQEKQKVKVFQQESSHEEEGATSTEEKVKWVEVHHKKKKVTKKSGIAIGMHVKTIGIEKETETEFKEEGRSEGVKNNEPNEKRGVRSTTPEKNHGQPEQEQDPDQETDDEPEGKKEKATTGLVKLKETKGTAKEKQIENTELQIQEAEAKKSVKELVARTNERWGPLAWFTWQTDGIDEERKWNLPDAMIVMGLQLVQTPATGNCQAYSVVQALLNSNLAHDTKTLEQGTVSIKKGCVARAQMDFGIKFPPGIRKQTLRSLGRGYDKMSAQITEQEFRKYLEEYKTSTSDVSTVIGAETWGSNETLSSIGTFLQRDIFVISRDIGSGTLGAIYYAPETRIFKKRKYAACGEFPITMSTCIQRVTSLKKQAGTDSTKLPIVLHFQQAHYQAYVHGWRQDGTGDQEPQDQDESMEEETSTMMTCYDESSRSEQHKTGMDKGEGRTVVRTEDKRDTRDIVRMNERRDDGGIHHVFRWQMDTLIRQGSPHARRLLDMLHRSVTWRPEVEQIRLLEADITNRGMRADIAQEFDIPERELTTWYNHLRGVTALEGEQDIGTSQSGGETQVSEYVDSSDGGKNTMMTPAKPRKRKKRTGDGWMEDSGEKTPDMNQGEKTLVARELYDELAQVSNHREASRGEEVGWQTAWNEMTLAWKEQQGAFILRVEATTKEWKKAVEADRDAIIHLIGHFTHPHKVLELLHNDVFVILARDWRKQCWEEMVCQGKQDKLAPVPASEFKEWEERVNILQNEKQKEKVRNSATEWAKLRRAAYGQNALVKLVAPKRRHQVSKVLTLAYIYGATIAAMVGQDAALDDTIVVKLKRHIHALKVNGKYKELMSNCEMSSAREWEALHQFMLAVVTIDQKREDESRISQPGSLAFSY